ncbi:SusC/RagA family TonB-linked outer membrane protein [Flavihumibacter sp. UBA7668]|uniref:SusC/RagA family TonB-linked outer membrane protein n=1 Tax=Flavihumibacter sp. UBA7668 TaxID=1946542 RepID=UPI0025C307C8|nr:TonB-dependent receptor [Flavihumibacter sp. UBA7668]
MMKRLLCQLMAVIVMQLLTLSVSAQSILVTGKVSQTRNQPLPGATITVKDGNVSTISDDAGNFSISVPSENSILIFTYQGMNPVERSIPSNRVLNVEMETAEAAAMNEVVVVGYGTQRKSVVTGAISSVKASELQNVPNTRIEQSLQGRVSGVTIQQNSGQPGSASTIRVRGVTTFGGGNNPLWVVDGVVVDAGGIAYINQNDIESIEVLKDAASAAIYGTRAATGVILISTKKGKSGKLTVSYNGFYGTQAPAKKLDLLNATQYATLMNERAVAGGGGPLYNDPSSFGKGSDWQDVIFNKDARRYSHEISMSGGNERSTFFLSFGMQDQDGIVATEISKYTRKSFRINSTHKISKVFTFGQTFSYARQKSIGLGNTNSEFGGPLSSAINLDPITKVVVTDPTEANGAPYNSNPVFRDANGNPYGISTIVGQEMTNPLAYIQTRLGNHNWSDDFVGNAYLEAAVTKNIKVRSTLGGKSSYWGNIGFTPVFYLNPTNSNTQNNYGKGENKSLNWNLENTINYSQKFNNHDVSVLLGQGAYVENIGGNVGLTLYNLPISSYKDASFRFDIPQTSRVSYASEAIQHKIASYFARVNYSYADKYLFTGIIRRDGSTRFGADQKWGVFPSFSMGWVVSNENFWGANNVIKTLKIRGGYGVVGNDALADFRYLATISGGYNYSLGNSGQVITGYSPTTLDNPALRWEETSQANIGFDATLFHNLNMTVDFYNKKTSGILRPVNIPGYVGVPSAPFANIADMQNLGVDIELGYRKQFGKLGFAANGNMGLLKNEVTYVAADANFIGGEASFQSMGEVTRTQVGQSYNSFFGYKSMGIFQNDADILAHTDSKGDVIQPNARPGDFRWQDTNDDGIINAEDRVFLGTNIPKMTYGLTINLDYKGFDLMVFTQGAAGSQIFQGLRRLDIGTANYPAKALGRWTGEGSSNDYPRLVSNDPNGNFSKMSDFYLEKGDYLRLKLLQIGYTLPSDLLKKISVSRLRVYITAENLLTFTGYTGYDPEVGGGVFGIDRGQYPQARSILGGIQLQF